MGTLTWVRFPDLGGNVGDNTADTQLWYVFRNPAVRLGCFDRLEINEAVFDRQENFNLTEKKREKVIMDRLLVTSIFGSYTKSILKSIIVRQTSTISLMVSYTRPVHKPDMAASNRFNIL